MALLQRALLVAALLLSPAAGAAEIPPLTARVSDVTGTLTADQRAALEAKLATFEASKGSQVAVLLVPTTQPESIEQYSLRVVEQWKLGRKKVDDGVLLIVAKDDRKVRIEVGYGLEGVLPDAIAKRIVEEAIVPRFKAGDFYGGITAGVDRILRVIEGEALPPPEARPRPVRRRSRGDDRHEAHPRLHRPPARRGHGRQPRCHPGTRCRARRDGRDGHHIMIDRHERRRRSRFRASIRWTER